MKHQKAIPFLRHCGKAPSGCDLRVEVFEFDDGGVIAAWGMMGDADPEDPSGALAVEREMAIASDYSGKVARVSSSGARVERETAIDSSQETRAERTRAVLVLLAELCGDEPPEAELYADWMALKALAQAAAEAP
jgi:hypothetical protein